MGSVKKLPNGRYRARYRGRTAGERAGTSTSSGMPTGGSPSNETAGRRATGSTRPRPASRSRVAVDLGRDEGHAEAEDPARVRVGGRAMVCRGGVECRSTGSRMPTCGLGRGLVRPGRAGDEREGALSCPSACELAIRDGRLARDPTVGCPAARPARGRQRFLTHGEVAKLAAELPAPYDLFASLPAYTGLRFGEVSALRVRSVDLARGRVVVDRALVELRGRISEGTKTHRGRTVPVPRLLRDQLADYCSAGTPASGCSRRRAAGRCGTRTSGTGSSTLRCSGPAWCRLRRTTCGTRRPVWRWRPVPASKRCSGCWATRVQR